MKTSKSWFVIAGILAAAVSAAGCESTEDEPESGVDEISTHPGHVTWAVPEWSGRKAWYRTPQGSFLVDDEIFLRLERADSSVPFASAKSLEPLGFVYPPPGVTDLTDDPRLPLGVVRDQQPGDPNKSVGFTCAACHTGVVDTPDKATRLLVDGGQSFIRLTPFLQQLGAALDAAITIPQKHARVCASLSDCDARLAKARDRVNGIVARNKDGAAPEGPGRVDALTREANEIFSHQLAGEPTYTLDAPISLPQVWDAPRLSCLQTNCIPLTPLSRNVAEQIAVFGETKVHYNGSNVVAEGTTEFENLYALENALVSLKSPQWRNLPLPALDEAKVQRGAGLFKNNCASCHTEPYRNDAPADAFATEEVAGHTTTVWKATAISDNDVGTDNIFLDRHFNRFVSDPVLIDIFNRKLWYAAAAQLGADPENPLSAVVIAPAVTFAKAGLAAKGFYDLWGDPLELAVYGALADAVIADGLKRQEPNDAKRAELETRYEFYRKPGGSALDIQNYKARPLNGIAFTAPFGHGGAWPTLRAVIDPASRPRSFVIRPGSFDPIRVGLDTQPAKPGETLFEHDTTKPGNGADGHTYGAQLSPSDKDALLEYLRSI